jgi:hypothetical protein
MAYLRYELRALCRRRLGDLTSPYKWSDDQVNQWINDAIAAYSIHFTRRRSTTIACSDDDRSFQMPAGTISIISVEYPDGEDPPTYLYQRELTHPDFWGQDGFYAFAPASTDTSIASLYISEKPSTGEDIVVEFTAEHDFLDDDDTDQCTILERHLDLIILYVRMAAFQELSTTENADPDTTTRMSDTLETNAARAESAYRKTLQDFIGGESSSSTARWDMDRYDRVY